VKSKTAWSSHGKFEHLRIKFFRTSKLVTKISRCSGKTLVLYSGGSEFPSWLGHRLSRLIYFVDSLSPSREAQGQHLHQFSNVSLKIIPSSLFTRNLSAVVIIAELMTSFLEYCSPHI
jgi:hypothetical protein